MSESNKTLIYKSIACFLDKEIKSGTHTPETAESLEVAKECIETAFHFTTDPKNGVPDLQTIFESHSKANESTSKPEPNEQDKALAEMLKNQGNMCMREEKFEEAVACYNKALELSPNNAVYYCNRAAAYSRLDQHEKAIKDCKNALEIDPQYSKAYGRMGRAYSSLGDHAKAVECYQKGCELDPSNENFRQNLTLAEEKLRGASNPPGMGPNLLEGLNLGAMLNNPMMQNMARQFMSNPDAQNMMSNLFRSAFTVSGDAPPDTATGQAQNTTEPNSQNEPQQMDDFLRLGQQIAQQLQASNPQLVNHLRQTFHSTMSNTTTNGSSTNNSTSSDRTNQDNGNPNA